MFCPRRGALGDFAQGNALEPDSPPQLTSRLKQALTAPPVPAWPTSWKPCRRWWITGRTDLFGYDLAPLQRWEGPIAIPRSAHEALVAAASVAPRGLAVGLLNLRAPTRLRLLLWLSPPLPLAVGCCWAALVVLAAAADSARRPLASR